MNTGVYLDHVGIAVADLAASRTHFEQLGFQTTPLSLHASPPRPGAPVEPSGSGNHCIMLGTGYIELLGVVGPSRDNSAQRMLDHYEGAHILALGSNDAAASRDAIAARGFTIAAPVALERDAPFGPHGAETRRAIFANAHLDQAAFPEAHTFVIEHKTQAVLWQPHLLTHPNGATGLLEAWICPEDPAATAARFARLAGTEARNVSPGEWTVPLQRGQVRIMDAATFAARTGAPPPAVPGMAGLAVTVRNEAAAAELLASRGIPFRHDAAGLLLTGPETHGAALLLTAAP